ncbi:MAG: hypothetical protein ACE1ZL_07455 [Gammaproteobacteria bacterium]
MKIRILLALIGLGLLGTQSALADDNIWLGAKAGTLGIGFEATWRPTPILDFRAGVNNYSYNTNSAEAGIDYDSELDLNTFYATANLRAPMSPFRLTAGIFSNRNEVNLVSQSSATYDIGGMTYTGAEVGTLNAAVTFEKTAPYLGVGADFRIADTLGLNFDLGVLWQGTPVVGMTASGPITLDPNFQAELAAETVELQNALNNYKAYPVVSIGLSFNF